MRRLPFLLLALCGLGASAHAQDAGGRCTTPDTILVRGNSRVDEATIRADAGISAGVTLSYPVVRRVIHDLIATGQFDDVQLTCAASPAGEQAALIIQVSERLVLGDIAVTGVNALSDRTVKDRVDMLIGRPIDPGQIVRTITRIDSLYQSEGYYLARVHPETTTVNGKSKLTFRIEEGRRLAISGVRVKGADSVSAAIIVKAMKTRPEGFWWFRRGEFADEAYAADLADRIPSLYAKRGFIDFRIVKDTLIVDRERGKALIELTVDEGPRYEVGDFEVLGNRRFSADEVGRFYPFKREAPGLPTRLKGILGRGPGTDTRNVFDRARWDDARQKVQTAYNNEGYIYARVTPVVDRVVRPDSSRAVNLRWDIDEGKPAIINRIDIGGNDYTHESCIRNQLVILPGDVFNQDRLIRSYQNIANLGFFETPLPFPDTRPINDEGDVDIVFKVKEKRTGNINFGASMGQGTGLGGFIGLDQPNLFGQCKRGSLQWQFGRYINDFNLSYTDPTIKQSQISGTATAYHTQTRFLIADLGRSTRIGGQLQFGFPAPRSRFSRLYVSYGGEAVQYGGGGLLGTVAASCSSGGCFRSTLGLTGTHDTRIDLPFATGGGMQTITAQFNGGPLGGTANFQRYTTELRAYAPLGQMGGTKPGSQPLKFMVGITARAGALFGSSGPFFYSQQFALGGTQFGEQLRGYDEFSISPQGYIPNTSTYQAQRASFGNAFFSTTAELGLRFNANFYPNIFFDAGNLWNHPRDFDPTRLFRGAGVGVATVTPLGPLGLDWAYGFDRVDQLGRRRPKWQLHFKLGQLF